MQYLKILSGVSLVKQKNSPSFEAVIPEFDTECWEWLLKEFDFVVFVHVGGSQCGHWVGW
jgi:hypothetical protein